MKHSHIYELTDSLQFGKYRGYALQTILLQKPKYILWCIQNVAGFQMSARAWDYAASIDSAFVPCMPTSERGNSTLVEMRLSDGTEILTHYPWRDKQKFRHRFMEYARTIAEDVMELHQTNMPYAPMACQLELQFA